MEVIEVKNPSFVLGQKISEAIKKAPKGVLLLVSGGSSFSVLEHITERVSVLGMIDERYDVRDDVNNFSQLEFDKADKLLDSKVRPGESFEDFIKRFRKNIEDNLDKYVIVILGIGEDGHTAGIMPGIQIDEKENVIGIDVRDKNKHPLRVTVTPGFLINEVDKAFVFVSGEKKKEALNKVLADNGDLLETPGRIIHEMKDVILVTDIYGTSNT